MFSLFLGWLVKTRVDSVSGSRLAAPPSFGCFSSSYRPPVAFDLDRHLKELSGWALRAAPPPVTIRYGPHPAHQADLRLPDAGAVHPVALLLHGGFWRERYDRSSLGALSVGLSRRGFATLNVEYRRVGAGGGVPETLEDVQAAVDAVARVEAPIDRSRIVAVGHSAGGHLALWLAGTGKVTAAVSLAGVCDLAAAAREGIGDGAAVAFTGGTPEERPDAYALADPMRRLPTGVPQLLAHGDADDTVPIEQARSYARAARAAGDTCELLELRGAGHFELIDPRASAWPRIAERVSALAALTGSG
jgi:acetyl esterase/lipase